MELDNWDWMTRKLMTTNHIMYPKSYIYWLYLPRVEGLLQMKQTMEEEQYLLNDYIKKSQGVNQGKPLTKKVEY